MSVSTTRNELAATLRAAVDERGAGRITDAWPLLQHALDLSLRQMLVQATGKTPAPTMDPMAISARLRGEGHIDRLTHLMVRVSCKGRTCRSVASFDAMHTLLVALTLPDLGDVWKPR
ncbi:hypothetical protein Pla175_05450 [Pirellulimonas nuda]|uniref:Uncharacterized protein n=1 Tax=Pirellulimonas nuda TaxID=2528009 RepID=A0A518D6S7_9BACT|nr:hypothetical protein [Pirellulimonas nuda]QDU87188.1 hypothetical protein Pla175_05450 [Pirellulimonas nuda]